MGSTLRSHEAVKRCEKHPFCRFAAPNICAPDLSQLFSKQFQKGYSRKLSFRRWLSSEPRLNTGVVVMVDLAATTTCQRFIPGSRAARG
jgi:hypothetical protein